MHALLTPQHGRRVIGAVAAAVVLVLFVPGTGAHATLDPGSGLPTPGVGAEAEAFADATAMTPPARRLFLAARPSVVDAATLAAVCQRTVEPARFLLGCVDPRGRIHLLRIDRPELAAKMPVTAAHEMLHLAFQAEPARSRARLTAAIEAYLQTAADDSLRSGLDGYPASERIGELHARLGTEVAVLPPILERHYARFLRDRGALVASWAATERAMQDLEARMRDLRTRFDAENAEAVRLGDAIGALRDQGRIGESNVLVPDQNAAVTRARDLSAELNALIADYTSILASLAAPGAPAIAA